MSVGHELQQKRAERQLSVEQLAAITKLKISIIEALENVDVDELPPLAYVIGYLRVLAAELKLDSEDYVERYVAEFNVERVRAEEARLRAEEARLRAEERRRLEEQARAEEAARAEALAKAELARVAEEVARLQRQLETPARAAGTPPAARSARPKLAIAVRWPRIEVPTWLQTNKLLHSKPLMGAALALVVLFAVAAFYPADRSAAVPVAPVAAQTEAPPPDAVPASATPAGPPMRAEIVLTKPAFVSASADGRPIVSREMSAGERTTFEAHTRAVLRVSDPSAVTVSIDGQPARPLGTTTRSATFEVTRDAIRNLMDR
jgi:cytoskeleton protein RodZ